MAAAFIVDPGMWKPGSDSNGRPSYQPDSSRITAMGRQLGIDIWRDAHQVNIEDSVLQISSLAIHAEG